MRGKIFRKTIITHELSDKYKDSNFKHFQELLAKKVCNNTQFGRAMKELGITMIYARSAPAKGRVERLWETLQSRLPVEFQIAGVKNIDEANKFLKGYISEFNYSVKIRLVFRR